MRLRAGLLGLLIATVQAHAQFMSGPIYAGLRTLQERQLLPTPDQIIPTQPSGFPVPPPQHAGDLPKEGLVGADGGTFKIIHHGGSWGGKYPLVHADGGIEFSD